MPVNHLLHSRFSLVLITILLFLTPLYKSETSSNEGSSDFPQPIVDVDHSKPHETNNTDETENTENEGSSEDLSDKPDPIIDHPPASDDGSVKPTSSSTSQNESHSEATIVPLSESEPKYGNTVEESKYLIVWESECLEDVLYDIKVDSDKTDEKVQTENVAENHNDPVAEFERKTVMQMKLFDKIDIIPFLQAIQKNEPLSMLDYNFTVFFIYIIVS